MRRRSSLTGSRRVAALASIALAGACDILGPKDSVDVYDVTTTLETFSFETAAPSPPDCPGYTMYCTHVRAFSGATLSGTMSLTASGDSLIPSGTFTGKMCSSYDVSAPTGCTAVKERTDEYGPSFSSSRVQAGTGDPMVSIHLRVGSGLDFKPLLSFYGAMRGDSIIGTVGWAAAPGRSPPTHTGKFVAVRR